jgi:hypothetical protein
MDMSPAPPEPTSTESDAPREAISFFAAADAPDLMRSGVMSLPVIDPDLLPHAVELAKAKGDSAKVLFHRDSTRGEGGTSGLSLVWVSFAPGYILPRHSH